MVSLLIVAGTGFCIFCVLFTVFCFYHLLAGKKAPMDDTNIFNHMRLFWFALTRPEKFVKLFPWLQNDEWENFT